MGGKWRGLGLKQVSLKAGRKEEQTNLHRVGSARVLRAGGQGKVLMQKWKETARATRKEIRGSLSPCSNSSPPQTPAPSCGCSLPPPQILPGHADPGLCCLPGLTPKSFLWQPQPQLSLSPSPHCQSTHSPLWTFTPGWVHRGNLQSKDCQEHSVQCSGSCPQDTLEI